MGNISLVIFTCEGREHLLLHTVNSFKKACNYPFTKIILALDGQIAQSTIEYVAPDIIIQSPKRKGYVNNIMQALKGVDTEYFFWLEDDWTFNKPVELQPLTDILNQNSDLAEITYSKFEVLSADQKSKQLMAGLYHNGFSANPSLCKTADIKGAFANVAKTLNESAAPGTDSFELMVLSYLKTNGRICAILEPVDGTTIIHAGELESTAREYHMMSSLKKETFALNENYISGFSDDKLTFYNKLSMIPKLFWATLVLSFKLMSHRQAYDFAFRIYMAYLRKFKY